MSHETFERKTEDIVEDSEKKFFSLEKTFGENFNKEKSIKLDFDINERNERYELKDYEAYWAELVNPDTKEVVEGKIYLPVGGNSKKLLIICPGYKGDFVLQESRYADHFIKQDYGVIVLRHNGIRIGGEDVQNYIHCPQKVEISGQKNQSYIGDGKSFSFVQANREVLIALHSLGNQTDTVDQVDILGHSWGARIALESVAELKHEHGENSQSLRSKIRNLILLGPWLESRKEVLSEQREYFQSESEHCYFNDMQVENVMGELNNIADDLKQRATSDFPENTRIVGITSVGDTDVDWSQLEDFFKQIKGHAKKGNIALKDLAGYISNRIGGREAEVHDYLIQEVIQWVDKIINTK